MKYLVFDTYALCYRAYYGYPELKNLKGESTSVIVGFFKQFFRYASDAVDAYPVFLADMPGSSSERKQVFGDYKANRSAAKPEFYEQVDFILEAARLIGTVYQHPGREADDLAGVFVERYAKNNTITLVTVDADWLQLLQKNVTVIQLMSGGFNTVWNDSNFFSKKGIAPKQLIALKALVGDGSDNIPGVPGIGEKTGIELLKQFDDVNDIYSNIIKVPNKRHIQERLIENEELVRRNEKIISLNTSVDCWEEPNKCLTDDAISQFIDKLSERTNADSLINLLGVYLQKRKNA